MLQDVLSSRNFSSYDNAATQFRRVPAWRQCTSCPPLPILRPLYFVSPFLGVQRTKAWRKGMCGDVPPFYASLSQWKDRFHGRGVPFRPRVQDAGFKAWVVPSPTSLWGVLIVCCFAMQNSNIFFFPMRGFRNCFCFVVTLSK